VARDEAVMGRFRVRGALLWLGWATVVTMTTAAIATLFLCIR